MAADPALTAALRRFERRAVYVAFVEAMIASALVLLIVAETAFVFGWPSRRVFVGLASIAIVLSAVFAFTKRPTALALARRIDARGRMNDLIVTALTCGGDGLPALVRRSAVTELARFSGAAAYPVEAPRFWRGALVAAALAQIFILPFAFRAPAERAPTQDLTALTLPAAGAAAPGAPAKSPEPAVAAPAAPATTQAPANTNNPMQGTSQTSPILVAAGSGAPSAGDGGDRIRMAAANAEADIAAGRVPLARRAIVTRYFAAIDKQRRQPR